MTHDRVSEHDFALYPPEARALAISNLQLFNRLPIVFRAILLREVLAYDWNFPAERRELDDRLGLLKTLSDTELISRLKGFAQIHLSPTLENFNAAVDPIGFMEQLTALLWSTAQMASFRATAEAFAAYAATERSIDSPSQARLGIVVIGQGARSSYPRLFRKLRPQGVYFDNIQPQSGLDILLDAVHQRSARQRKDADMAAAAAFDHWYIDGGGAQESSIDVQLSYSQLQQPRMLLLERMQKIITSGSGGPEALRSFLAKMQPADVGLRDGMDPILSHFAMSLLTQGSGTQIFATTFVQWAARECLRRAQPETLLLRFAPRQQLRAMNLMLSQVEPGPPDPQGSLIDADMGAYYTWLNMRRLAGADQMRFLAWFEGHAEAIAIGPGLPAGTSSSNALDMQQVVGLLS